jgi:REP element-mobilizing transposase RayT
MLLQEGIAHYGFRLHGHCLMTNHLHLVVQAGEVPLKWTNWRAHKELKILPLGPDVNNCVCRWG